MESDQSATLCRFLTRGFAPVLNDSRIRTLSNQVNKSMLSFEEISAEFTRVFSVKHFPDAPSSLYEPAEYFLGIGGKRIRPAMCLMANELFGNINPDAYHVATAIELFHNFTLIHDDIMDKAPLRRGMATVHTKFGESTALLAGDVMMVKSYEYLNRINPAHIQRIVLNSSSRLPLHVSRA